MLRRGTAAVARMVAARRTTPTVLSQIRRMSSTNYPVNPWLEPRRPKEDDERTLIGLHGPVENMDLVHSTEKLSPAFCRHRVTMPFRKATPGISVDSFVAPNCTVLGEIMIAHRVMLMYGCVVRGDENDVTIYPGTVIQENCVITSDAPQSDFSIDTDGTGGRVTDFPGEVIIESNVMIGPGCVLRACKIEQGSYIGAGSTICEGAIVEEGAVLKPGSVVPPGRRVPAGTVWEGSPIKYVKDVESWEEAEIVAELKLFSATLEEHMSSCYPIEHYNMLHKDAAEAYAAGK